MSYEVACNCGQTLCGERQARHQVLSCPGCGDRVFVLPASPLATPLDASTTGPARAARRWWWAPLAAALASVAALLAAFAAARPWLSRSSDEAGQPQPQREELLRQVETGRHALGQGKFHVARRLLGEVIERRDAHASVLSPEDNRRLNQLHRQADLLARLSSVELEEIVRRARLVRDPAEWALQLADHRGRSIVFDDVVRRDEQGRPVLGTYVGAVGDEPFRVALEDLTLLRDLPLDDEPRLVFGARLRNCEREEGGWVVRFEPDSGVLLTDPDATALCLPPTAAGQALEQVLARQQRWLDERAVVQPARP